MNHPFEGHGFRFLEKLGQGGTAEVARVLIESTGRQAALKYPLETEADPSLDFDHLVSREYALIGSHRFPGLVRLFARPEETKNILLMEICEGPALDELRTTPDLPRALNIISAVALGLEYLNARGIIHGDLKPQNVFLPTDWSGVSAGGLFYPRLSDFSLGRFLYESEESRAGLGTIGYMAPETILESRTSHSSDLFALGTLAYQLLSGRHPFLEADADPAAVTSRIVEEATDRVDTLRSDVSPELADLVHSLLSADEERRPGSALEVCNRLAGLGASYPYEKALRPDFLIDRSRSVTDNVRAVMAPDCPRQHELEELAEGNSDTLHCILRANFSRGNMRYSTGRFEFVSNVYWPARLRRKTLTGFVESSLSDRKRAICAAVAARTEDTESAPLHRLLKPLLRQSTMTRLSARLGREAERIEDRRLAAALFVQSGELKRAEENAFQAIVILRKNHENEQCLRLINRVVRLSSLSDREFDVRQLLIARGDIHKDNGDTELALQAYEGTIALYEGHPHDKLLAETHKNLGDLYKMRQNVSKGIEALEVALRIFTELDDQLEISHTLNNIANLHFINSDLTTALKYYRTAFHIQRRLKSDTEIASTLTNIGGLYGMMGRLKRSIRIMLMALELKREIGHLGEIARSLNNLGFVQVLLGDFPKAVEYLTESLEINRKTGNQQEILINLSNLTETMIKAGQLKKSLEYLREYRSLAENLDDATHAAESQYRIATVLRRTGRYAESLTALSETEIRCKDLDYRRLQLLCHLERAKIRHFVGDNDHAIDIATEVLREARDIKDIQTNLESLQLLVRLTNEQQYFDAASELMIQQKLDRESTLLQFASCEASLDRGDIPRAIDCIKDVVELPLKWQDDIELPWMCNIAAQTLMQNGLNDRAEPYLTRAERLARNSGLKPELADTLTFRGKLRFGERDFEGAFAKYREALSICKELAGSIPEASDKTLYQGKRLLLFLIGEIRRISELLTKK